MAGMPQMTPEMMRMAQEQMSKMSPEQMAQMAKMAQNMNPEMMRNMAGNISPDQMKQASEQMKNMSGDDMQKQFAAAQAQMGGRSSYMTNGAAMLKEEGNKLVKAEKYGDAVQKYERAKANLSSDTTAEAAAIRKSCTLNLGLCYLKLKKFDECITACTDALREDKKNVKALSRRGMARRETGDLVSAVSDIKKAANISPNDETIKTLLADASADLEKAKEQGFINADEKAPPEAEDEVQPAAAVTATPAFQPGAPMPGNVQEAAAALKKNPEMMRQATSMMKDLSPEQIEQMAKMSPNGMNVDPAMVKQSAEMMKNMSEKDLEMMMDMASKMQASGAMPAMGASTSGGGGGGGAGSQPAMTPDMMAQASKMMEDPKMMESMSEMMKNMSPETLEAMSAQAGYKMTAEQAAKTAEMMKNVKPEHMQKMMKVAMWGQGFYTRVRPVLQWVQSHKMLVLSLFGVMLAWLLNSWVFGISSAPAPAATIATPPAAADPTMVVQDQMFPDAEEEADEPSVIDPGEEVPSFGSA